VSETAAYRGQRDSNATRAPAADRTSPARPDQTSRTDTVGSRTHPRRDRRPQGRISRGHGRVADLVWLWSRV